MFTLRSLTAAASSWIAVSTTLAQSPPPSDLRPAKLDSWAIVGAEVVPQPGEVIADAAVLLDDGVIVAVGPRSEIEIPPGTRVLDATGLKIYPGLIDATVMHASSDAAAAAVKESGAHWNERIVPQVDASRLPALDASKRKALRELGFTTAAVLPDRGILRGSGAVWPLGDDAVRPRLERGMMSAALEYGGDWQRGTYPGAFVGSTALLRQTLLDAAWHAECEARWASDPEGLEPPQAAAALAALADLVAGRQALLLRTESELQTLLAARIAEELGVDVIVAGSGLEFRRAAEVAATGLPLVMPLSFPEPPSADTPWQADATTLRDLLTWEQAPTNIKRLLAAGCTVALTADRLERVSQFPEKVREAMAAGLSFDEMLATLTTTPARLLGVDEIVGTIEPGKQADLVLVEGELFAEKSKVREVWVGGVRHEIAPKPVFALSGAVEVKLPDGSTRRMSLDPEAGKVEVTPAAEPVEAPEAEASDPPAAEAEAAAKPAAEPKAIAATAVRFLGDSLSMRIDGKVFGLEGSLRIAAVVVDGTLRGIAEAEDGTTIRFTAAAIEEAAAPEEGNAEGDVAVADAAAGDGDKPDAEPNGPRRGRGERAKAEPPDWTRPLPVPLGAFGLASAREPERVLFRAATLWTCGPSGVIESGDLLIEDGRIAYAGPRRDWSFAGDPPREVDLAGRHISPGLIDCHSHTGLFGGVNEATSNCTAEVRMSDAIDPDDIDWYRQLAGGLTAANQLHGSANPIGGQNSVVKIRWGDPAAAMRFEGAPAGIKFALGENVVRPRDRYPETRMGVEAFLDDCFEASRRLRIDQRKYEALSDEEKAHTMPPRPDLELEALAEILEGSRLVHCHSYRQDEILMLLRLAERHGFTIGTLQHVLEGYKVAEAIAAHGAGASSFSDWWAYKMEVMDAIPENGAIMDQVGVVVSFNSDSDEHARRMNTEAAKAVRYGGLTPERALLLVTLNPARQLRIDDRVGSLESGKDADLAVWSAPPLSSLARCEQTWVDGVLRFSLEEDARLAAESDQERMRLLAKAAGAKRSGGGAGGGPPGGGRGGPPGRGPMPTEFSPRARGMLTGQWLEQEEAMFELLRRGRDPMEAVAGGCGTEWMLEEAGR